MAEAPRLEWRRSSYSTSGENCVEVTYVAPEVALHGRCYAAVRDSKNPDGPMLVLEGRAWRELRHQIKAGAFDRR
ncbi:protein of unknown function [Actinomadura meyerae]|jgi:hypothetical protein|uniref:DUF397 domain-containing protein n=1 Tax=Actinomadura meyerae TaxID=240840 RepID=A0A239P6X1_9ACTN|nr:DUF397 domain-containing protein [Actinomadura meyerae]SNT62816.1 protein of unknown function [Actinomadura meyerae]